MTDPATPTTGTNTPPPVVSVIMPVRNEAASIDATLRALANQTLYGGQFEILVVDGRSDDDTRARITAWSDRDPRIQLLDNPQRTAAAGLNIGIRAASSSVIARMDGHAVPEPGYLERCVQALGDPTRWSTGGRMLRVGTTPITRAIAGATMSPFGVGDSAHNYATVPRQVETVFLGCWPRWVFERIGLFDEELVRNQDDEMSFRIREAGGQIWYDPAAVVAYEPRTTYARLFSQYAQYATWKVRVFQKHPRAARIRHLVPPTWVGVMAGGAALAPFIPAGVVATTGAIVSYLTLMGIAAGRIRTHGTSAWLVLGALVTLHLAYGIGFWFGLVRFAPRWVVDRRGRIEKLEARVP